jgi:putative spermidine/putrescine transport system permease protein
MFRSISTSLYRQPWLLLLLLLAPPLLFLLAFYIAPLLVLLLNSFFRLDDFTGQVVPELTLSNYAALLQPANLEILLRTAVMAAAVTVACAVIAFPLGYYIARYASPRWKGVLYLAILLPLWSSYLIRVYAWKLILAREGIISWVLDRLGLAGALDGVLGLPGIGGPSLSFSPLGVFIVFVYVWLPYMILPIQAALERVPSSLIEASGDLGARPNATFRHVVLPLAMPGVIAGSIFTFSLTLGDFVVPTVLGNSSFFLGQAVLSFQGSSGNIPLAAAFTVVPVVIMILYLMGAKRLGALEAL